MPYLKQQLVDQFIADRDTAQAEVEQLLDEVDQKVSDIVALESEIDNVRGLLADTRRELDEAVSEHAPSDLSNEITDVFAKTMTEWLMTTTYLEPLDPDLRTKLVVEMHEYIRLMGTSVDNVLDEWGVGKEEVDVWVDGTKFTPSVFTGGNWADTATTAPIPNTEADCGIPDCTVCNALGRR